MKTIQQAAGTDHGRYPERILQFGEGNFLRAFADWMIDDLNEKGLYRGSICLCQPIPGNEKLRGILNEQDGDYTVIMRGMNDEGSAAETERIVTSVSRCINAYDDYEQLRRLFCSEDLEVIISNTTEAGICYREGERLEARPAECFPAKLTQLLHDRYEKFGGKGHGLLFLPVELIDDNGYELRKIILRYAREWDLGEDFCRWIEDENMFASTLVDRIVTGFPADEIESLQDRMGYRDQAVVTCESFSLWVIEGDPVWQRILPLGKGDGGVIWTEDVRPYKMRKVRVLNGGHTSTVLAGILSGHELVLDLMESPVYETFLRDLLREEVIPGVPLAREEVEQFARDVLQRFRNPYIRHRLLDISMNSCAKFVTRCLPSLLAYQQREGSLPDRLVFSLAALIRFYRAEQADGVWTGRREDGSAYPIRDSEDNIAFFADAWAAASQEPDGDMGRLSERILGRVELWGMDLSAVPGLPDQVAGYLERMKQEKLEEIIWEISGARS
ncbi:MAG: tagaturonate reductase [Firmicutes bacterium]|nr:tagaturonate reductase [Bacillota bacterium]